MPRKDSTSDLIVIENLLDNIDWNHCILDELLPKHKISSTKTPKINVPEMVWLAMVSWYTQVSVFNWVKPMLP